MDHRKLLLCLILLVKIISSVHIGNGFVQYYQYTKYHFPLGIPPQFNILQDKPHSPRPSLNREVKKKVSDPENENLSLKEGSLCRRSTDGQEGICVLATHCQHVIRQFRKYGAKVDICSYRRNVAVVCCPMIEKRQVRQVKKRISVQKCEEYLDFRASFRYKRNATDPIPKCQPSNPLIVGGESTYSGEFPHMAAIGWSRNRVAIKWACGGSLISEFYILTAAHCTLLDRLPPDIVRLGQKNLIQSRDRSDPQNIRISKVIRNPGYKMSSFYHDIALLKLAKEPRFSRFVRPACLWQFRDINAEYGVATGWGKTKFDGERSNELLKVDLKLAENKLCNQIYKNMPKLPQGIIDEQICAGYLEGGKDTCNGDSGGPIHITVPEGKCINYIIGITSFGRSCAEPESLGVYTKVYSYLDWIEKIAFNQK